MKHPLAYYPLKLVSYMPFWLLYAISDILYFPLYYIVRYRRKIVRRNLTESFPDKSLKEIKQIERKFYRFFVDMALEDIKLMSISHEEIRRRITFKNIDKVNDMLEEGKSVSAYIGHYGNWEWLTSLGLWLNKKAVSAQIYHQLANKKMDKLITDLRESMGNKCVDMYATARYIINAQKDDRPYIIGFIADQSPKMRESKHFIRFLNHNAPVLTGTEKLTKHFGYEAVFISMKRVKRGYYHCEFSLLHPDPASLPDFELTALYFNRLEQEINQQPELYLWTHNRFKYARKD